MNLSEYRDRRIILSLETLGAPAPVSRESSLSKAVIWTQRQDSYQVFVWNKLSAWKYGGQAGGSGVSKNVNIIKQIHGDKNCNKPRHAGDAQCADLLPPFRDSNVGIFVFPL